MMILERAQKKRQPVVLLLGAGVSIDAGIPLAVQLKEYLTQMHQLVRDKGFSNARQYVEEARWPSRHDLRAELLFRRKKRSLSDVMPTAERLATQAAMVSEIRRDAPMLASSLQEIFGQLDENAYNNHELEKLYVEVAGLARSLGRRSPQNVAYRSLLFHLCDRNQTTIDACLDHFIRDRVPATTHQFIYFLTQLLNCRVILTTNFDPLLEVAFAGEGLLPRVYEVHGEGSIPSGQLLLSQPLSIVKLHGGAHQLQTGFDLDDPLSPAALSTFADLFRRLQQADNEPPLIIALGYSGSDRRVMDIITNQIREWRSDPGQDYQPRVLWVNRDPWVPELLKAAVRTHPEVMQHGDAADDPRSYPAHVVRYREGRMFLLEVIQRLKGHFPIARSHYQAVNFVQHSTEGDGSTPAVPEELAGVWRMALIHSSKSGEGSSSALVSLADELERNQETRTIWIDLTEVVGVAALFDVLSERLVKLDSRLHAIRRPPVMQWLLDPTLEETSALRRSRTHELRSMAQWLRQALRRGRYLIALDSVDEFPNCHPALDGQELKSSDFERRQRKLLLDLFQELLRDPSLLGDSRIALALSGDGADEIVSPVRPGQGPEPVAGDRVGGRVGEGEPLHVLIKDFERFSKGHDGIRYAYLPGATGPEPTPATTEKQKQEFKKKFEDLFVDPTDINSALAGLVVLVSACARRIRSEVMLLRCVSEFIGRLLRDLPGPADAMGEPALIDALKELICKSNPIEKIRDKLVLTDKNKPSIWGEAILGGQHKTDLGFPQLNERIRKSIRTVTWYEPPDGANGTGRPRIEGPDRNRQWIYRTEGGYHWMHRDVRNGLYNAIKEWGRAAGAESESFDGVLAAIHHTIALYSYDELYERSRDARSFLEYMFHRIVSIRLAVSARRMECVGGWLYRLGLALHREKHALLTRARVPGLIHMVAQLIEIVGSDQLKNIKWTEPETKVKELREKIDGYRNDLRNLMAEFLLASGYPHSAFDCLRRKVFRDNKTLFGHPVKCGEILSNLEHHALSAPDPSPLPPPAPPPRRPRSPGAAPSQPHPGTSGMTPANRKMYRDLRDLAYACQDPLLSAWQLPTLTPNKDTHDWPNRYVEQDGRALPSEERATRLNICKTVYTNFITLARTHLRTQSDVEWSEPDLDGDLVISVIRRLLEFRLTQYPVAWLGSAEIYWDCTPPRSGAGSDYARYKKELDAFKTSIQVRPCVELNPALHPELYEGAELLCGTQPLLRSSARRRRNESHRLCLLARLKVAEEFGHKDFKAGGMDQNPAWWQRIRQHLEAAEAILSRNGDPADRQTMAITRLTVAELLLRRAETRLQSARNENCPDNLFVKNDNWTNAAADHAQSVSLLSTVDGLLNEGRGENRWRFFYLLTRARSHMFYAATRRKEYRRQALIDLRWAARHLIGATSNCGLWTDRYDILGWWWDTWQSLAKSFYPNQPKQLNQYLEEMKAMLGVRWHSENGARRDDRWNL